jgi:hypothetical protein
MRVMLALLPDALGMALTGLTHMLYEAGAVPLTDVYKAAFGVSIATRHVDPRTGEVRGQQRVYGRYKPEALAKTNRAFRRLLISQGMSLESARKYVLVGDYTHARTRDQVLLAVVLRHTRTAPFRARHRQTGLVTTFSAGVRAWYEPYEHDVNGQVIDEVIDWAPLAYGVLHHDKAVATLLVLATEAVKFDQRSPDYWRAERRWLADDTTAVVRESEARMQQTLEDLARAIARRGARRRAPPTVSPRGPRRMERRSCRCHRGRATRGKTTRRAS